MDASVNVLALVKEDQRYIFLYDDASRGEMLRQLGRFASDPELDFTWYDAAVLSQKVRRVSNEPSDDCSSLDEPFDNQLGFWS